MLSRTTPSLLLLSEDGRLSVGAYYAAVDADACIVIEEMVPKRTVVISIIRQFNSCHTFALKRAVSSHW